MIPPVPAGRFDSLLTKLQGFLGAKCVCVPVCVYRSKYLYPCICMYACVHVDRHIRTL